MRSSVLFILVWPMLQSVGFGVDTQSWGERAYLLPWQTIAKEIVAGGRFCENIDLLDSNFQVDIIASIINTNCIHHYAHRPNKPISIKLPQEIPNDSSLREIKISIAEFAGGSWLDIGKVVAMAASSNEMKVDSGIGKEGLYRLRFAVGVQDGRKSQVEVYVIVSDNWKKDVLAFCRELKEEIETNPDDQLIRSSISVSHCDHVMELISEASVLSEEVLKALSEAVSSKQDYDAGKCPDLVVGLNKIRLKRFEGSPIEEFVIFVPANYASSKAWPVFVHTDIRRLAAKNNYSSRSGLIDLWWHTISYKDIRWKDYTTLMEIIEQKLNIDQDRKYVSGNCRNGVDAMALALNYPDQWAECSVALGNSYRYLAGNALNLPLVFVKGGHNEDPFIGFYNYAVKCFQYRGCRYLKHSITQDIAQARGTPIPEAVREENPRRVLYTIESLGNPKAYWVKIEGREDENLNGMIDVSVEGQTVFAETINVDAYSLNLVQAPLDLKKPVEVIENGKSLGFFTDRIFTKKSKKQIDAAYLKNDSLHGPVWDAFTDPFAVVWGVSGEDKEFSEVSKKIAKSLAGGGPCFTDINMPEDLVDSHNLILVGTAKSNLWLSKIYSRLPVRIEKGRITAGGKNYDGQDMGFVLVYPNPINIQKYVVVFSGTSSKAISNIFNAYSQMKSIRQADVGIFEITDTDSIRWHIIEKFNTVWDWHGGWDRVLITVNKKHPKWRWCQWVARTVRKQLEVDVVVCEDVFIFNDSVPVGQITYRELFNTFRNVWFTKIRVDGKSLRELLTVPFRDISKREVNSPVIDGISFVKIPGESDETTLIINELVDDTFYTVALPEKCLNGERMGLVVNDYDIVDQKYLLPMLKEYLNKHSGVDVDDQLKNLKFKMY